MDATRQMKSRTSTAVQNMITRMNPATTRRAPRMTCSGTDTTNKHGHLDEKEKDDEIHDDEDDKLSVCSPALRKVTEKHCEVGQETSAKVGEIVKLLPKSPCRDAGESAHEEQDDHHRMPQVVERIEKSGSQERQTGVAVHRRYDAHKADKQDH